MRKILLIAVPVVGLLGLAVIALVVAFVLRAWFATPYEVLGFGAAPPQPIAFPHTKHVEDAGIDCVFCHRNVTLGKAATVPAIQQCMFCHKVGAIQGTEHPEEVDKLREAWEEKQPISWERVYRVPDHVRFSHEPHLTFFTQVREMEASQTCLLCHGDVGKMEVMKQVSGTEGGALKMADCVDCHRRYNAPTDCVVCHH